MPLKIKTLCSGVRHVVTIANDGTMTLQPDVHDVELETSLAELGAELPRCLLAYQRWYSNPFYFIQEHIGQSLAQTCMHNNGIIMGLGIDFAFRCSVVLHPVTGASIRNALRYAHEVIVQALKLDDPMEKVLRNKEITRTLYMASQGIGSITLGLPSNQEYESLACDAAVNAILSVAALDTSDADNARHIAVATVAAHSLGPGYVSKDFDLEERMTKPPTKAIVDREEAWQRKRTAYVLRYYRKNKLYPDLPKLPRFKS